MNQSAANLKTCQIIALALIMGVVMFGGIAAAIRLGQDNQQQQKRDELPMLLIVAVVGAGGMLMGRGVVLSTLDRATNLESAPDADPLQDHDALVKFQTRTIIGMAMLEGPAFLALISFMVEGRWESLAIAAFLVVAMVLSFPFEDRYRSWYAMNVMERNDI